MRRNLLIATAALAVVVALTGCGPSGPLTVPEKDAPKGAMSMKMNSTSPAGGTPSQAAPTGAKRQSAPAEAQ